MNKDIIFADVEGDGFLPDLTTMWTIQIATTVDGPVVVYADQEGYPPISEALKILKECYKVVFHYGMGYDYHAINKLYPNTLRTDQMIDSVIISRLMDATSKRHNLADLGEAVGLPKGDYDDFSQFTEEMATYGRRDVEIIQKAWKGTDKVRSFGEFYETFQEACDSEFYTAYVIEKMRQHGFRFDLEHAEELEVILRSEFLTIEKNLQNIFPPIITKRFHKTTGKPLKDGVEIFNPASRDQITKRLKTKYRWKPIILTKGKKAKVDEDILAALPYPEAQEFARYLKLGKMLGQLSDGKNAWLKLYKEKPNEGVFMHGFVNTLGCRTHRMSHGGPNMAQVNSDPRMRACWVPDMGEVMVGVDADGLELRMLSEYLKKYDDGAYIKFVHSGSKDDGTDVHSINTKAAGMFIRDNGKTMIYAHNYGCFDLKLGQIALDDLRQAGQPVPTNPNLMMMGKALRSRIEVGIVGLGDLIAKCKRSHGKRRALPALDGRWIPSASAHSALNTLLQGNGSIVMKVAFNEFDKEMERLQLLDKFSYLANVHDEFQMSVQPDFVEKVEEVGMWSIKRAGEVLGMECPLVGTAKHGANWSETH